MWFGWAASGRGLGIVAGRSTSSLGLMSEIRQRLVAVALEWEKLFGNSPSITSAISEYDAAMLVGMTESEYSQAMRGATSVQKGFDFKYNGLRYQVKGTRPSGKPGSNITKVPSVTNFEWDCLVWVSYTPAFEVTEAWAWEVREYRNAFESVTRISPAHMRQGKRLAGKHES